MKNLAELRKAANLTQQDVADELKVGRTTVTAWETGENMVPAKYLLALANILGCTVEDILQTA